MPGNPYFEPARRRDLLEERLQEYTGLIAEVRHNLPDSSEIVYSPLFEVHLPQPWYHDRVVVIGDAAHAVVPHLSQCGAQSLEDAVALAEELAQRPVEDALPAFMNRRFDRSRHLQRVSFESLTREMNPPATPLSRDALRTELSAGMAAVRAYLDQPF